jgi:hypothetical protein
MGSEDGMNEHIAKGSTQLNLTVVDQVSEGVGHRCEVSAVEAGVGSTMRVNTV